MVDSGGDGLKPKVDKKDQISATIPEGMVVAEAFAVNSDNEERMVLLKEPLPENPPDTQEDQPQIGPRGEPPPPVPGEMDDPGADFDKAKMGQLGPESRGRALEMLRECKVFFPKNTKIVIISSGREVELPLYDENVKPGACKAQRFSPHMSNIKRAFSFAILRSARIVPVLKKDRTYRTCID